MYSPYIRLISLHHVSPTVLGNQQKNNIISPSISFVPSHFQQTLYHHATVRGTIASTARSQAAIPTPPQLSVTEGTRAAWNLIREE